MKSSAHADHEQDNDDSDGARTNFETTHDGNSTLGMMDSGSYSSSSSSQLPRPSSSSSSSLSWSSL
eukprot:817152-Pyramimonas_sp.AAC.1